MTRTASYRLHPHKNKEDIIMYALQDTLDILQKLIALETVPENSAQQVLAFVEGIFQKYGLPYEKTATENDHRGSLLARIGPRVAGGLVLSGHLDVVSVADQDWTSPPFVLTDKGDRLVGRGTCDMKGFVACVLSMIPYWLTQKWNRPLYIALTTDEETQSQTIKDLCEVLDKEPKPALAIIGEPTLMNIVTAHKGTHAFVVEIQGKSAHSSRPDLGISAIEIAHDIMSYLRNLARDLKIVPREETLDPPYITVNIGKITGGTADNIVPEHCKIEWHLRQILNAQAEDIEASFRAFIKEQIEPNWAGAKIKVEARIFHALEPRATNKAADFVQTLCPTAVRTTAPFATEAGYFQKQGLDVVVCGPGSIEQAHKPDEFVLKSQIEDCLKMLGKITG